METTRESLRTLSHCKLMEAHHRLHRRWSEKSDKAVVLEHVVVLQEMEARGVKHRYRDALDRNSADKLTRRRRRRDARRRKRAEKSQRASIPHRGMT